MVKDSTDRQASAQSAQPIGHITIEQIVRHSRPLYAADGFGVSTYGTALDDHIRAVFADDNHVEVRAFHVEIGEEAAAALRDRCNRGEY